VQHLFRDLGQQKKDAIVTVRLRNKANVRLMTASEYRKFKAGKKARYLGGGVSRNPFQISIPSNGHWVVVVDLGGLSGQIGANVAVSPPPEGVLPTPRSTTSAQLRNIAVHEPQAPEGGRLGGRTWDVFISHAHEDLATVARPLYDSLTALGVEAWLDDAELKVGQSLRRRIDEGIRSSRFGVVILSESFFGKGWAEHELDGLVTRSNAGEQSLLPIWHNLDVAQVRSYSPSLADKMAILTRDTSVEDIAAQIAEAVQDAKL